MDKVTGRTDDMIILRGVNVFPTQIEEQILAIKGLAPHFQIELNRDNRLDSMIVHVEKSRNSDAGELAELLSARIKDVVGITAKVNLKDVGTVPRSEGKAVRILDNRSKE
jgi:phenylacetate-CoA ligase